MRRAIQVSLPMMMLALSSPVKAEERAPSPIRMSQIGFESGGPKLAIIPSEADRPLAFRIVDADGQSVFDGETVVFGHDTASGETVHRAEFSALIEPGEYRLAADGIESRAFTVSDRPWSDIARDSLSLFHQNRAAIAIEERHVERADLARPAAHLDEVLTCFSGTDQRGNHWPGCDHELDVTGGWYDAGDHGKYVVNGGITVWTLMDAFTRFGAAYGDGALPIPESGNGTSDLLDEIRWGMEFMLAMQIPDDARMAVPVGADQSPDAPDFTEIDAGGMAHHKTHNEVWTPLPLAPHEDEVPRFLYPPSTAATLNLAASAAMCARVWAEADPAFAVRCLNAAERAWEAAERHPDIHAIGDFNGGGGYGDGDLSDEAYWAAAELYATTEDERYDAAMRASRHFLGAPGAEPDTGSIAWPSVGALGTITLATAEIGLSEAEREQARAALVASADRYMEIREAEGYAFPLDSGSYVWGSNGDLMNRAMVLALASDLTGEARYRAGVIDAMDYVMGRNVLDQSYVTGYGARPMQNPHHRHWAHAADPSYPRPPAGVISGGANNSNMSDPIAMEMEGSCAPQACWADHIDSYAMNEVAVNWNAPFFWVAAWLDGG